MKHNKLNQAILAFITDQYNISYLNNEILQIANNYNNVGAKAWSYYVFQYCIKYNIDISVINIELLRLQLNHFNYENHIL